MSMSKSQQWNLKFQNDRQNEQQQQQKHNEKKKETKSTTMREMY